MALQSLLHDPNISSFLDQIPQNQRVITLKQLIYIGIKIVNNEFNKQSTPNQTLNEFNNKENIIENLKREKPLKQNCSSGRKKIDKKKNKQKQDRKKSPSAINNNNQKTDKIESTLLREISKIRVQLQTLTNKVYDHYFQQGENDQQRYHQNALSFNKNQLNDRFVSYGFRQQQEIPTFSPQRNLKIPKQQANPFLKSKSGFHYGTSQINNKDTKNVSNVKRRQTERQNFESRNRGRSNIQHLDDTQIRQALYKEESSQSQSQQKIKTKKSQSMIQRRHEMKKKEQQNFFYQLNVQKQRLHELKRFQESKNCPQASYRQFSENLPPRVDHIKKKVKSKIKPEVERDRLRYQNKVQEENFKKGFQQYEYSANQQVQEEDQYQENDDHQCEYENDQREIEDLPEQNNSNRKLHQEKQINHQKLNSPQQYFQREKDILQPNFGFYGSQGRSLSSGTKQRFLYNSQNIQNDKVINAVNDESSFSQFSQFSMSSSNSKRENGKISRRRNQ